MSIEGEQGNLLAEREDIYGSIRVVEQGAYRFLEFGQSVEQSCVFTTDPSWLEYDYTRAMFTSILFQKHIENVLFLGLGAGSLTQACQHFMPQLKMEAIELREEVVFLAKEYFGLANIDDRFVIHISDAQKGLEKAKEADLVFMDLYTDHGPCTINKDEEFLLACQKKLKPGGWLVINQWIESNSCLPLNAGLFQNLFNGHYWECSVTTGNIILFIPKSRTQKIDVSSVREQAIKLELRLGYSLMPLINKLRYAADSVTSS